MEYWNIKDRKLTESSHTYDQKIYSGFFNKYLSGSVVLDIGYKGDKSDAVPILPSAIGIDLDYPGYDGQSLPFANLSVDSIYTSHCLEHIPNYCGAIIEWFRVLKVGGYLIIVVPDMFFYEKKQHPPSNWNPDHKRFYTPSRLLREIEETLDPYSYQVCHLTQNHGNDNYFLGDKKHSNGPYEIELVIRKKQ